MDTYSVGDAARALNVSDGSIRNWTENEAFKPYLSNAATRTGAYKDAKERRYIESDLHVLNTIRVHKDHSNSWQDVADLLADGLRETDLPISSMLTMPETRSEAFQTVSVLLERAQILQAQVDDLKAKLEEKDRQLIEATRGDSDLLKRIGQLEFILRMNGIDPDTGEKE